MNRISFVAQIALLGVALATNACSSDGAISAGGGGHSGLGGLAATAGSSNGGASSGGTGGGGQGSSGAPGTSGSGVGGAAETGGVTGAASGGMSGATASAGMGGATGGNFGRGGAGGAGDVGGGGAGQSGGASGSSATGGAAAFNPCKARPCVVLPLGDSITHGYSSSDDAGYRSALFKLVVAANQQVTFIGSQSNGPSTVSGQPFPKNHEGHDGFTVTGIAGYVPPQKAFMEAPHIVLLHIGTNDMTSNANPSTTASELDALVTNLVQAAPDALIVVAKIIPLGYSNTNYDQYIAKIPDVVKAHVAKNEHVVMVDMSALPSSDIRGNGNVHPTDKGYADMADLWYGVIKGYLPN